MATTLDDKFESLETILAEHLPADVLEKVNLSLRGPGSKWVSKPDPSFIACKRNKNESSLIYQGSRSAERSAWGSEKGQFRSARLSDQNCTGWTNTRASIGSNRCHSKCHPETNNRTGHRTSNETAFIVFQRTRRFVCSVMPFTNVSMKCSLLLISAKWTSLVYKKHGVCRTRQEHTVRRDSFSDAIRVLYTRKVSLGGIRWIGVRWTDDQISCRGQIDPNWERNSIHFSFSIESEEIQHGHHQSYSGAGWGAWRCFLEYGRDHFQSRKCHRNYTKESHSKRWENEPCRFMFSMRTDCLF